MTSLKSELRPDWISVKDGLPEEETPVLIMLGLHIRIGERRREEPTYWDTYKSFWYWDDPWDDGKDWQNQDVTHWMPLPEPPIPAALPVEHQEPQGIATEGEQIRD